MREIKFRAWCKQENIMLSSSEICDKKGDLWAVGFHGLPIAIDRDSINKNGNVTGCNIDHYLDITQYTGIKDLNGKEIYEGDIVEYSEYDVRGIVKWMHDCIRVVNSDSTEVYILHDKWSILGNIYEHPELLEKGKK